MLQLELWFLLEQIEEFNRSRLRSRQSFDRLLMDLITQMRKYASMKDSGLSILSNLFTANLTQKDVRLTRPNSLCLPHLRKKKWLQDSNVCKYILSIHLIVSLILN